MPPDHAQVNGYNTAAHTSMLYGLWKTRKSFVALGRMQREDGAMDAIAVKRCTKCGEVKPVEEFHKDASKRDGLRSWCRECKNADGRTRWKEGLIEETTEGYLEQRRERSRRDRARNPGAGRALDQAKRKAGVDTRRGPKLRTPPWLPKAERATIDALYDDEVAKRKAAKLAGQRYPWIIDHIVPIDHRKRLAGGTHVLANLQVIKYRPNTLRGMTAHDHKPMTYEECAAAVAAGLAIWSADISATGEVDWRGYEPAGAKRRAACASQGPRVLPGP